MKKRGYRGKKIERATNSVASPSITRVSKPNGTVNEAHRVCADEKNCKNVSNNEGKALELVPGTEGKERGKERESRSTSGEELEDATVLPIDPSRGDRRKVSVKTDNERGFPPLANASLGRSNVTECIQEDGDSSGKPFGTRKRPRVPFSPTQRRRHLDDPKISVVSRGAVRELPTTVASGCDENAGNETVRVSTSCNGFRGLGLDSCIETFAVQTRKGLGLMAPTACQSLAVPAIMSGKNVIIKSETGSGKTFAYLLPLVSLMSRLDPKVTRDMGTLAIVIAPTRELAMQIYSVLSRILYRCTWIVGGCISGGEKRKSEKARIRRGVNVMVATPGRLLDHLRSTQSFKLDGLRWMVLDEVDRLVDLGFMQQVQSILQLIETKRQSTADPATPLPSLQSIMASATLPPEVKSLGASFFGGGHVMLDSTTKKIMNVRNSLLTEGTTDESQKFETPKQLVQLHMVVPQKLRLVSLCAFLRRLSTSKKNMKAIIFISTCDSVNFHYDLLQKAIWPQKKFRRSFIERRHSLNSTNDENLNGNQATVLAPEQSSTVDNKELVLPSNIPIMKLHGNISQSERSSAYKNFFTASQAVLLCTDVAARGLDLPEVDWIVQYDPPAEISDYIHRVGRTARRGRGGHALLFVLPTESELLDALSQKGLRLTAMSLQATFQDALGQRGGGGEDLSYMLQESIEDILEGSPDTLAMAKAAFQSHVRAYGTKRADIRSMFQVRKLHLGHVARSFALRAVPTTLGKVENQRSDTTTSSSRLKNHWRKCKQNRKATQRSDGGKRRYIDGEISGLEKLSPLDRKKKRLEKQKHSDISEFGS